MAEALIYPHTHLRLDLASLVLAVFEKVALLQPSEAPPKGAFAKLISKGWVEIITPPPFGEKLLWFERLVASYEEWGQMMRWPENVSLFKAWPEAVEESVAEIKTAILGRSDQQDDPILRARVLLQLAQNLDQRLEELDFEFERLKEQAARLSDFVVGKDPTLKRFPHWIVEGREPNWELQGMEERMRAFARLVPLLGELPEIIATDQIEVRDTLLDLAQEPRNKGRIPLVPVDLEGDREPVLRQNRQRLEALLKGVAEPEPEEGPKVEVWEIPHEIKSLLSAAGKREKLRPGRCFLYFFSRL